MLELLKIPRTQTIVMAAFINAYGNWYCLSFSFLGDSRSNLANYSDSSQTTLV